MAPITALVERIRSTVKNEDVPYVDPTFGGVNARVMFLLETPSPDNDDGTAANLWELYRGAGLPRELAIHWNAVPWGMGDETRNRNADSSDIVQGVPWLAELIGLLPELRLVVAMGDVARRAFALYLLRPESRLLPWIGVAHPSGRVRATNPDLWKDMVAAFAKAAEFARADRQ